MDCLCATVRVLLDGAKVDPPKIGTLVLGKEKTSPKNRGNVLELLQREPMEVPAPPSGTEVVETNE